MSNNRQVSKSRRKPDRRIERTKKLLGAALIELILEGDYDSITIQNITDRANLSRATFYLHYKDKEELLFGNLESVFDDIAPEMGAWSPEEDYYWNGAPPSLLVFQHVADNADLYRVMLKTNAAGTINDNIRRYLAVRILYSLEQTPHAAPTPVSLEILSQYVASALKGLLIWWLEHDMPYSPDEMARQYHALMLPTLRAMLK